MKALSEGLIKSFIDDIREAVNYCNGSPKVHHFHVSPQDDGFQVTVIWGKWDAFSYQGASEIGERFLSLWNVGFNREKYKGIFNQIRMDSIPCSNRCSCNEEDSDPSDYNPEVYILFKFGPDLKAANPIAVQEYSECIDSLFKSINRKTGESTVYIMDRGDFCYIGKNFIYRYSSERVEALKKGFSKRELNELSKKANDLLDAISAFNMPIISINISPSREPVNAHYFYRVNDEYVLWRDFRTDPQGYRRVFGNYYNL